MDRTQFEAFFLKNQGLIHSVARKGAARAAAVGCSTLEYDDLVQELTETFIKAYDLYDPAKTKFSTYFVRSAYNRLNELMAKVEVERVENGVRSVEEMGSWASGEEGEESLGITVEDVTSMGPEATAQMQSTIRAWHSQLSGAGQLILEWTLSPPDYVEREFIAQQAHAEMARNMGIPRRARLDIDASFVAGVLKQITGKTALFSRALEEVKAIARNSL